MVGTTQIGQAPTFAQALGTSLEVRVLGGYGEDGNERVVTMVEAMHLLLVEEEVHVHEECRNDLQEPHNKKRTLSVFKGFCCVTAYHVANGELVQACGDAKKCPN